MNVLHQIVSGPSAHARNFARRCVTEIQRAQPLVCLRISRVDSTDELIQESCDEICQYESLVLALTDPDDIADSTLTAEWQHAVAHHKPVTVVLGEEGLRPPLALDGYPLFDLSRRDKTSFNALARHLSLCCDATNLYDDPRTQADARGPRVHDECMRRTQKIAIHEVRTEDDRWSTESGTYTKGSPSRKYRELKVPEYFTDRTEETQAVIQFLDDESGCILAVHGRQGIGKSALVGCALRKMSEAWMARGERGRPLIHVNAESTNSSIFPTILERLAAELDLAQQRDIEPTLRGMTAEAILTELAGHLDATPCLIVIDKFEHIVEPDSNRVDRDTAGFLQFVASDKPHPFKVILTTRVLPDELKSLNWPRYRLLPLLDGLPSPIGERLLRDMDDGARLGMKSAPQALLTRVLSVTHGYPLAIERFISMLMNDPFMDLENLTVHLEQAAESGRIPAECEPLLGLVVGEAFGRLAVDEKKVMQAVSAYEEPVPLEAIEFLLEKWAPDLRAVGVLRKLLQSHFVARDRGHFHLHKIDRDYALGLLPPEEVARLRRYAAGYFKGKELPLEKCSTESDLQPQFAQFKLYLQSGDGASALAILEKIVNFLVKRGFYVRVAELARWLSVEPGDERVTCKALQYRADALWCMGEVAEALEIQQDIDKRLLRVGTSEEQLESKGRLIRFNLHREATEATLQAARDHEKTLTSTHPGDAQRRAFAWHNVVACEFELGYLSEAIKSQQRAYAVAMDSADADLIESATLDFALIYAAMGEMKQAGAQIEQALELSKNNRNARLRALHLGENAWHAASLDKLDDAIDFALQAKTINERIGDLAGVAYCTRGYAEILLDAGKLDDAQAAAQLAWQYVKTLRFPDTQYRRVCAEIALARAPRGEDARDLLRDLDIEDSHDWNIENLLGTSCLGKDLPGQAQKAFERARRRTELYLSRCRLNVDALSGRAFALAGLACCGDETCVPLAKEAYAAAAQDSFGAGTLKRLERRLRVLRRVDASGNAIKLLESIFPRPKVYVSYRWTPESQAAVDQLMRDTPTDFWLIRDSNEMQVGDSIDEYMQRIGASKLTIVVISDGYLRSKNCMTELLYMWRMSMGQRKDLMQRIVPLMVGPLSIADVEGRRVYGLHWAEELKRARAVLLRSPDYLPSGSEIAEIQKLSDLQQYTTDILAWFADTLMSRSGDATIDACHQAATLAARR